MTSQRTTIVVAALTALGILGLGVTARPPAGESTARLESLESDLRFQIEMSWRHDGRTRAAREAALGETLEAWKSSPQAAADRRLLEEWLRAAVVATLPGENGAFPPTPAFGVKKADEPSAPVQQPPRVAAESAAPQPAVSKSAAGEKPRDVTLKPGQAYTPPKAKEFRITPRVPGTKQARADDAQLAGKTEAQPGELRPGVERPVAAAPVPAPAPSPSPRRVIAAKPVDQPPPAAALAPVPTPRPEALVEQPMQPMTPPTAVADAERDATPVMVNLAELNAQIRGYHAGLDEIEATVVARRGKLTEGEVARLVGQLEQLASHYQFVRLYYDGLTPRERQLVRTPRRMGETIALVEGEWAALAAEEQDFLTALEAEGEEDELTRRLQAVAAEVGGDEGESDETAGR